MLWCAKIAVKTCTSVGPSVTNAPRVATPAGNSVMNCAWAVADKRAWCTSGGHVDVVSSLFYSTISLHFCKQTVYITSSVTLSYSKKAKWSVLFFIFFGVRRQGTRCILQAGSNWPPSNQHHLNTMAASDIKSETVQMLTRNFKHRWLRSRRRTSDLPMVAHTPEKNCTPLHTCKLSKGEVL